MMRGTLTSLYAGDWRVAVVRRSGDVAPSAGIPFECLAVPAACNVVLVSAAGVSPSAGRRCAEAAAIIFLPPPLPGSHPQLRQSGGVRAVRGGSGDEPPRYSAKTT